MSEKQHSLDFISDPKPLPDVPAAVVLFGEDRFLIEKCRKRIIHSLLGDSEEDSPISSFLGKELQWRDLNDELASGSLFSMGMQRPVIVDEAATFITANRPQLEKWIQNPSGSTTLILQTATWLTTTKLHKMATKDGLVIDCRPPQTPKGKNVDTKKICDWLVHWAKKHYSLKVEKEAAGLMVDLCHTEFGMMDSSLMKMSLLIEKGGSVGPDQVMEHVGGWKTQSVWAAVDAALEGDPKKALTCLHPIFHSGEHALSVLVQLSWSVRRYAMAYDHYNTDRIKAANGGGKPDMTAALKAAGFRAWGGELEKAGGRLKKLGRRRLDVLHHWLLDVDLALKGVHSSDDLGRQLIERLMVQLAV